MKQLWTAVACVLGTGCAVDAIDEASVDDVDDSSPVAREAKPTTIFQGMPDPGTNTPFFASLGTNQRTCGSCHVRDEGWAVTPAGMQARFDATAGLDPAFRLNDGSTSPTANVGTEADRRIAYSMLLSKGLIRVGIGIPANAEFTLVAVDDPYGYASAGELSLFRRPLPSTNLKFLSAVMWDGREGSLGQQSIDATMGHAQATGTRQTDMDGIVKYETALYTANAEDDIAGDLHGDGAHGGPTDIPKAQFFIGINDPIGMNPTGKPFNPRAMTLFDEWDKFTKKTKPAEARKGQIHRGQEIFNTKTFTVSGVGGLNDKLGVETLTVTCTTCHDTPNVGNHSVAMALNVGVSDASVRTPDMPLYTLRNTSTGAILQTTDPGRALITGKWADIGKFKGPILRGVSLRPPYFHNGIVSTLDGVVDFYDARFGIGFTAQEKADLVAFLGAI